MSDVKRDRSELAATLIADTCELRDSHGIDRDSLDDVRRKLLDLAQRPELWSERDFPSPGEDEQQRRYQIAQEPDGEITLYLNVVKSGKHVPPHDHTTWACIAAVEGVEHNLFYTRTDDGSEAGKSALELRDTVAVGPGHAIAMMPDDIHTFEVRGDQTIRHLHFYGRPLESLSERKAFDLDNNTHKIMDVGVKTIV